MSRETTLTDCGISTSGMSDLEAHGAFGRHVSFRGDDDGTDLVGRLRRLVLGDSRSCQRGTDQEGQSVSGIHGVVPLAYSI